MIEEQGGELSADRMVRWYARRIYGFCRTMLRDEQEVEDACQEVFLTVVRRQDQLGTIRQPLAWVMKISRLTCLWIRRKRRPAVPLEEMEADDLESEPAIAHEESLGRIRAAMERVPERYQSVLLMYYQQGMSHEEIAEAMEMSRGALRVLLHRAVVRLRGEVKTVCAR